MNACTHCDEEIFSPIYADGDLTHSRAFCCRGCLTVYNIIHQKGLDRYYEIKNKSAIFKRRSPVENKPHQFLYLDNPDFLKEYSYINLYGSKTIEFYLEGIHCLACLWLIEELPQYLNDVKEARLDIHKSVVIISLTEKGKFANVARELNNLGYRPHALKRNQDIKNFKIREERKMLLKIGIAGAGAGNIMLYAVSIYAGADGKFASLFNFLSVLFALPVLFYSATPFYINAWNALKNKTLSIDIPISMALLMGAISGLYNLLIGVNENFFDSLTALVFLLLLSRYFLNKIQEEGLSANDLNFFYEGNSVLKKKNDKFIEVHPQFLKINDIVKISSNEMIPADGVVVLGQTLINSSLLTGESRPQKIEVGSFVFSGTINLSNTIEMKILKLKEDSRIGKILKQVESGWTNKSPIVDLTNKISKYFVVTVFLLSGLLFFILNSEGKTKEGLERAFTLLIVTCPCALALATPLTLTRTLSRASKKGIIIKNNEVVEKLSLIKTLFLDKTGTVTYGVLKIDQFEKIRETHNPLMDVILGLEQYSLHPVALSLKEYAKENGAKLIPEVKNYQEHVGMGVSGEINGHFYHITNGAVLEDDQIKATYSFNDHIRPDSKSSVQTIKANGIEVKMISGDKKNIVDSVSKQIGLDEKNVYSEVTPENKLSLMRKNPHALMVGDGANDAMALSQAFVGVAVLGSLDISLRAADIYLTTPGITPIAELIIISKETMKVVYRNLFLSLMYNSFSVYAAFTGMISPLVAAIIMPLSSLTVLVSTLIGTKKLNVLLGPNNFGKAK